LLGASGFRAGMDLYFGRHDGQAVTVEDFLAAFADATGADLARFKLWYSQAGTPEVGVTGRHDPARRTFALEITQTCPPTPGQATKKPMRIPIRFGLVGPNGDDLAYERVSGGEVNGDVMQLTETSQTFVFHGVSARPVPSLLRGFSAPVRLSSDLTPDDLLFLLRTDSDPFNRWRAAQALAMRGLIAGTDAARRRERVDFDVAMIDALADVAGDESLEHAFRAQVLRLPGEADVAREIGRDVDPDAIAAAHNQICARIADRAGARLGAIVASMPAPAPYSPDAAAAGRRALAHAALELMVANGDTAAIETVVGRYRNADNMTDRAASLAILTGAALPERRAALDDFEERYRGDPLVLDKWLSFEATVPAAGTLDRVRTLLDHPAFSRSNPNRIRALVGAFASANQSQFNRADGAGYDFLADFVIDLDRRNPQTAARLLVSFRSWRALEAGRRGRAEAALRRVAAAGELSTDVRDIVTRTLA
jgi:aminopeptidase N